MDVGVLGISYKSSELELRERFAKLCQKFIHQEDSPAVVILSTCNRTEIYFSSKDCSKMYEHILFFLERYLGAAIKERIYAYFGKRCFQHLCFVSIGIDSIIFGEAEIQRQVKQAYEEARLRLQLPFALHYLFQKSLKVSKEVRTEFSLPRGALSMEATVGKLFHLFFAKQSKVSILLVGYSAMNRNMLHFFKQKKGVEITIATRSTKIDEEVKFLPWDQLAGWISFDMVICASKSAEFLLQAEVITDDPSKVKSRLVLDLGLPRNVDPKVDKHPLISLFNIEDIGRLLDQKRGISLCSQQQVQNKAYQLVGRQIALYQEKEIKKVLCGK